jgi:hypothetical protein
MKHQIEIRMMNAGSLMSLIALFLDGVATEDDQRHLQETLDCIGVGARMVYDPATFAPNPNGTLYTFMDDVRAYVCLGFTMLDINAVLNVAAQRHPGMRALIYHV